MKIIMNIMRKVRYNMTVAIPIYELSPIDRLRLNELNHTV